MRMSHQDAARLAQGSESKRMPSSGYADIADMPSSSFRKTDSAQDASHSKLAFLNPGADSPTILPPELVLVVLDALVNTPSYETWEPGPSRKQHRAFLSRASLVCHAWCRALRPKLFAHIRLSSAAHVRFLLEVSRSEKSGWLASAVTDLELLDDGSTWVDLERSCKLLAGRLPSLQGLGYNTLQRFYKNSSPTTSLPSRALLARFTNIRIFSFLGATFLSFSALARVLGELPHLDQIALHHVGWIHQESYDRLPARRLPPFSNLRYILADDVMAWPLMLLWGPMLERRCISASEFPPVNSPDAKLLALLVKTCCESAPTARMMMKYEDDTIQIATWIAIPHWALNIKLWPSTPASTPGPRSAIRHIELRVMESKFFVTRDYEINWELVDVLFSREVVKLEHFVIGIDPGHSESESGLFLHSLVGRFPRLCELRKFNVKLAGWELRHDGFALMT